MILTPDGPRLARLEDHIDWHVQWMIEKYDFAAKGEHDLRSQIKRGLKPYETLEFEGNLLVYAGMSNLWQCLIGNGTATANQALTYYNNSNAAIGVGDSNTAAAATQTNLQASTNKLRKAMDATYPVHTDGTGSGANNIQFKSTFGSSDANFAWEEIATFNDPDADQNRMLNRKVQAMGTKASSTTWVPTLTITLS